MRLLQPAVHRTILVVDVERFADERRTNQHQVAVRDGQYRILRQSSQGMPAITKTAATASWCWPRQRYPKPLFAKTQSHATYGSKRWRSSGVSCIRTQNRSAPDSPSSDLTGCARKYSSGSPHAYRRHSLFGVVCSGQAVKNVIGGWGRCRAGRGVREWVPPIGGQERDHPERESTRG
jgi:hypothetical protein